MVFNTNIIIKNTFKMLPNLDQSQTPNQAIRNSGKFVLYLSSVICLSFILIDVFYVTKNYPCFNAFAEGQLVTFNTWMIVDAFKSALVLLLVCLLGCNSLVNQRVCISAFGLYAVFTTAWIFIGLRLYLKYEDPAVAYPWGFNLYMKMNSVFGIVFATVMDANLIKVLYTLIENWVLARSSGAIKLTEQVQQ